MCQEEGDDEDRSSRPKVTLSLQKWQVTSTWPFCSSKRLSSSPGGREKRALRIRCRKFSWPHGP